MRYFFVSFGINHFDGTTGFANAIVEYDHLPSVKEITQDIFGNQKEATLLTLHEVTEEEAKILFPL